MGKLVHMGRGRVFQFKSRAEKNKLIKAVHEKQVLVDIGEIGKTTQVTQYLAEAGGDCVYSLMLVHSC
jgi:HrpA-like RNA helicase